MTRNILVALLTFLLASCAFSVKHQPATLLPLAAPTTTAILQESAEVTLDTQYERVLDSGTRWQEAGKLPQGRVLRPVGTVFTLEGRDVHEAYLVVADSTLVGFYLPAEQAYSALSKPVSLKFK